VLAVVLVLLVAAANVLTDRLGLVELGPLLVPAGTFAAGLVLTVRDAVTVYGGAGLAFGAVVAGAVVSALTVSPSLAFASASAFLVSELLDAATFGRLRARGLVLAVVVSGLVGIVSDAVLFLTLAGFGLTWSAFLGQLVVKGAAVVLAAATASRWRP
jgi:uncharacterized PurR-regulated membrane protein YhhQ (DUF165 family)